MQCVSKFNLKVSQLVCWVATGILLLAVACGGAAAPAPTAAPKAAAQPAAPAAPAVAATATPVPAPVAKAPAAAPAAVHPGKLTWMIGGWGVERFSYLYTPGGSQNFTRIIFAALVTTNEKSQIQPGIATRWELAPDGRSWVFTIRDGAKFHDGKEITAEDVWWTWMHYFGKDESGSAVERATNSSAQGLARLTEKIELVSHNQVSFTRKTLDAAFPILVSDGGPSLQGIIPRRSKVHDTALELAYDNNPIGAGPGKLVKHVAADLMSFERFDDYYYQPKNGLPEDRRLKFKSLDMRLVPEEATRVAAIRAGEADIAPVSLAAKKQVEAGGGRVVFGPEGIYIYAWAHGCYKPQYRCTDKRVRQALDLAIDKTVLRDRLFGGPQVFEARGWSTFTPSTLGYSRDLDPWPQDVARARKLLAEAGYPGGKGYGKLIVNTWASSSMPFLPESAQLAADFWRRELGLDVELKVGDEGAIKKAILVEELHDQVIWRDNEARLDPASGLDNNYGNINHGQTRHKDPKLLEQVNQAFAVTDAAKRAEAFNKLAKVLREETYEMGIGYINIPWAVGPRVTAWQPWSLAFYPSNLHGITLK